MAFFETIRTMRQKQFLSQDALAKELDVTLSTVNRWETGKSVPNLSTMKKIKGYCESNQVDYEPLEQSWLEAMKETHG